MKSTVGPTCSQLASGCNSKSPSWVARLTFPLPGSRLELTARLLLVVVVVFPVVSRTLGGLVSCGFVCGGSVPGLGVGARCAAHHGEHLAAAGAEEARRQECGEDQEGDVEPGGVVPGDAR